MKKKITAGVLAVVMAIGSMAVPYESLIMDNFISSTISANAYEENICGDFKNELLDDETASICGYIGSSTKVTIPSEVDSYEVSTLSFCVFLPECDTGEGNNIVSITLPQTLKTMNWSAFKGCGE